MKARMRILCFFFIICFMQSKHSQASEINVRFTTESTYCFLDDGGEFFYEDTFEFDGNDSDGEDIKTWARDKIAQWFLIPDHEKKNIELEITKKRSYPPDDRDCKFSFRDNYEPPSGKVVGVQVLMFCLKQTTDYIYSLNASIRDVKELCVLELCQKYHLSDEEKSCLLQRLLL